jgi:hypothetical protein
LGNRPDAGSFRYMKTRGDRTMMKAFLALGVVAVAVTATPSEARRHYSNIVKCTKWRHGVCVKSKRLTRGAARRQAYRMGYVFGPHYGYTSYSALPRTYVTRYRLAPRYRYVYTNGYIYQVDPTTYAITRILNAF